MVPVNGAHRDVSTLTSEQVDVVFVRDVIVEIQMHGLPQLSPNVHSSRYTSL
jgi:hypothetical protein